MPMSKTERRERREARKASQARIEAAQAETRAVVASGACPRCSGALRRNLALTGWWQCAQFGAIGFRADASKPACEWQGFTHS
jgi:hypothetical protein